MKISDFPASAVRDMLWRMIDRQKAAAERWPFHSLKLNLYLSLDEARHWWAGGQWLERYAAWAQESRRAGKQIGIYPAPTSLESAAKFMKDKAESLDKNDPIMILTAKEMRVVEDCAAHLDHYSLMMIDKDKPRGNWKRK